MAVQNRKFSEPELEHLRLAGTWGLLRSLAGQKVCMTGKMSLERSQLAALVEAAGGQFTNTIGAGVNLLITANPDHVSTKVHAAKRLGVRVMDERAFAAELLPTPDELLGGVRARFGAPR